jgi:hypothetical protein
MKGRKQKISEDACPQKDRAALESYAGVPTFLWITESEYTKGGVERNMLEYVLSPANQNAAYKQVVRNNGVGGIDKMEVSELKDYLQEDKEAAKVRYTHGSRQIDTAGNSSSIDPALRATIFGQQLRLSPAT